MDPYRSLIDTSLLALFPSYGWLVEESDSG